MAWATMCRPNCAAARSLARLAQAGFSAARRAPSALLETARDRWRYVPGTRGGTPEAMWFNVPINFVLE